jgi:hypothetical protein
MQSFHVHQREVRRRRVVVEDRAGEAPSEAATVATRPSKRAKDAYADGARQEHQRKVADLVPRSYLSLGLLFLCGVTAIVGLAAGHLYLPELSAWASSDAAAAFDLTGRGSLGSWFSSLLLGLAALAALMVYSIRRHKSDDYRGRYRWWLLAAMAWMVMSVDSITGVHELFRAAMTRVSNFNAPVSGHVWWIACWGLIVGATVIRLLLDMRACKTAFVATVAAMLAWCAGLTLQFGHVQIAGAPMALLSETAKLVGHLLLLLGMTLYARHVILHAQGLLPARKPKQRAAKKESRKADAADSKAVNDSAAGKAAAASTSTAADKRTDVPAKSSVPQPHFATQHSAKLSANDEDDEDLSDDDSADDDDAGNGQRRLSKAERRRLRKQKTTDRDW